LFVPGSSRPAGKVVFLHTMQLHRANAGTGSVSFSHSFMVCHFVFHVQDVLFDINNLTPQGELVNTLTKLFLTKV
jgi:hypothetical protein